MWIYVLGPVWPAPQWISRLSASSPLKYQQSDVKFLVTVTEQGMLHIFNIAATRQRITAFLTR